VYYHADHACSGETTMSMNRRKVLVGLGTIVAGGGVAFGSGAFSTVSAERTVDASTTGDASGYVGITGDDEYISDDSSSGTLTINLGTPGSESFNPDATTELDGVINVTNNTQEQEDVDVGVRNSGETSKQSQTTINLSGAQVTFTVDPTPDDDTNDTSGGSIATISSGGSAEIDVTVDTTYASGADSNTNLFIIAEDTSPEDT